LHYSDYPQFDHQAQPSAHQVPQPAPKTSLEDTVQALIQASSQINQELKNVTQELKNATMANTSNIQGLTQATIGLEEWIGQSEKEYPTEPQLEPITQYWDNASIDDNNEEEELQG
jgi:hypothetical protein